MEIAKVRKPESTHGKPQQQPREEQPNPRAPHERSLSRRNDAAMATPKNTAVAARLAG